MLEGLEWDPGTSVIEIVHQLERGSCSRKWSFGSTTIVDKSELSTSCDRMISIRYRPSVFKPGSPLAVRWLSLLTMALASTALFFLVACTSTREFRDEKGKVVPGSIATMEMPLIGGTRQSLWIRASDTRHPILVLLHGGPGASESALFRHFNAELERHFVVVYWEQRGAGRSYHADLAPESMTVLQMLGDLDEVVDMVSARFGKDKVVLLGHSWGTVLGTLYASQHPDKTAAYVGVAPITNTTEQRRLAHEFTLAEAIRRGETKAIKELRSIGPAPRSVDDLLSLGRWTERFGGVFHGPLSTGQLIWAALKTDEASLVDLVKFGQGNAFSLKALEGEISRLDLSGRILTFNTPVFFLLGRYDWQVPATDSAKYFELIAAPCKRLIWFEQSAHNLPFEEPDKFNQVMIEQVLPVALGMRPRDGCTPGR
jgi:proline iminopeptidase